MENGGNLLVFGAAIDHADAYDWLPFPVAYQHDVRPRSIACTGTQERGSIVEDFDPSCIECDGTFPSHGGNATMTAEGHAVLIEKKVGKGTIVVTSIHEFPSRAFLKNFCTAGTQTLF